jgi:hypothetical protein
MIVSTVHKKTRKLALLKATRDFVVVWIVVEPPCGRDISQIAPSLILHKGSIQSECFPATSITLLRNEVLHQESRIAERGHVICRGGIRHINSPFSLV